MKNKSQVYGFYGGVANRNHYVPPHSTPFTPQPASVPFYENLANASVGLLSSAEATRDFFINNQGNIIRRHLVGQTDTEEFYELKTLNYPNDIITYVTGISGTEDLMLLDGGTF
jgi:hypothetical protein